MLAAYLILNGACDEDAIAKIATANPQAVLHGQITGIMKNQLDWIPLSIGAVRPTQGRT